MITRSMTNATSPKTIHRKPKYNVCIDFDSASLAWRANKKHVGNGEFVYVPETVSTVPSSNRWQRTRKVPQRYSS